jgi:hypothetical protein
LRRVSGKTWAAIALSFGAYTAWVVLIGLSPLQEGASSFLLEHFGALFGSSIEKRRDLHFDFQRQDLTLDYGAAVAVAVLWVLPTAAAWLVRRGIDPPPPPPVITPFVPRSWRWPAITGLALTLWLIYLACSNPSSASDWLLLALMAGIVGFVALALVRWVKGFLRKEPRYLRNFAAALAAPISPLAAIALGYLAMASIAAVLEVEIAWFEHTAGAKLLELQSRVVERPVASPPTLPGTFASLADPWIDDWNDSGSDPQRELCWEQYYCEGGPTQLTGQIVSQACDNWLSARWVDASGILRATHAAASAMTSCRAGYGSSFWALRDTGKAAALRIGSLVRADKLEEAVGTCQDLVALEREVTFGGGTSGVYSRKFIGSLALSSCATVFERSPLETRRAALTEIDSVESTIEGLPAALADDEACNWSSLRENRQLPSSFFSWESWLALVSQDLESVTWHRIASAVQVAFSLPRPAGTEEIRRITHSPFLRWNSTDWMLRLFEAGDFGRAESRVLRGAIEASIARETSGVWPVLQPPLLLEADDPKAPVAIVRDLTPFTGATLQGDRYTHDTIYVGDDSLSAVVHAH